jgi:hypothetical protein
MSEEKKCTYCAMMIPKEAKICPHCHKKMPLSGGVVLTVILVSSFFIIWAIGSGSKSPPRTPPAGSDPATATDDQIYREYEICMNGAKKTLADDKLKGQEMVVNCYGQLKKYGEERAKKAFKLYFDSE